MALKEEDMTIRLPVRLVKKLQRKRIVPGEPYYSVIERLFREAKQ